MIDNLLQSLGLEKTNAGTWCGDGGWLQERNARRIDSINPTTGAVIASVMATTAENAGCRPTIRVP